jgi:hypothetical protein
MITWPLNATVPPTRPWINQHRSVRYPSRSAIRERSPGWYAGATSAEASSTSTTEQPDLRGRSFRQAQGRGGAVWAERDAVRAEHVMHKRVMRVGEGGGGLAGGQVPQVGGKPGTCRPARSGPTAPAARRSWSPDKCTTHRKTAARLVKWIDICKRETPAATTRQSQPPATTAGVPGIAWQHDLCGR